MEEDIYIFKCENVGVSTKTDIFVKKHNETKYEARCGIALLGFTNMSDLELEQCGKNPFHVDFYDNCCVGIAKTQELAIEAMKQDMKAIADSLWL